MKGRAFAGVGLAPAAGAVSFQTRYMMVPFACQSHAVWSLHAVSVAALVVSLFGLWCAYSTWQLAGAGWPKEEAGAVPRDRFLGMLGLMSSVGMIVFILAQMVPVFWLDPCTPG